jgi:hypothetical protein
MSLHRCIAPVLALLAGLCALNAHASPALQALEVYPDEYPQGVAFFIPAHAQLERMDGRPGAWYAVYELPIYPGKAYDLLLAHGGAPARIRLYALNRSPFEATPVKYELNLRKLEFSGKRNAVYGTTIATQPDSTARRIYLLMEWLAPARNELPPPVVLQVLSSDPAGYTPEDRHGMYWSWHNEWQRPLNDLHVESPLQSEQHRYAEEQQHHDLAEQERRNAPPFRLLPY